MVKVIIEYNNYNFSICCITIFNYIFLFLNYKTITGIQIILIIAI